MKTLQYQNKPHILGYLGYYVSMIAAIMLLTLASCSSNGDGDGDEEDWSQMKNDNANSPTGDKATLRLEVPALHKEGRQQIIVHRLSSTGNTTYTAVNNKATKFDDDAVNFITEWDCDKKSQRWSCYQMHKGYNGTYSRVIKNYPQDPNIQSSDRYTDLIKGSGFEHGHICPSADRTFSYDANMQTFYMSNMQPQYHEFNAYEGSNNGLWLRMENKVQSWAKKLSNTDILYVCKGGTIDKESNILKRIDGKMIVPKYFFMAILRKDNNGWAAMAFWVNQSSSWRNNETLLSHAITIDELEKKTGIDFFCNLPDKIENNVEKTFYPKSWGLE